MQRQPELPRVRGRSHEKTLRGILDALVVSNTVLDVFDQRCVGRPPGFLYKFLCFLALTLPVGQFVRASTAPFCEVKQHALVSHVLLVFVASQVSDLLLDTVYVVPHCDDPCLSALWVVPFRVVLGAVVAKLLRARLAPPDSLNLLGEAPKARTLPFTIHPAGEVWFVRPSLHVALFALAATGGSATDACEAASAVDDELSLADLLGALRAPNLPCATTRTRQTDGQRPRSGPERRKTDTRTRDESLRGGST
eukprot:1965197-Rhodomonas_salina.1